MDVGSKAQTERPIAGTKRATEVSTHLTTVPSHPLSIEDVRTILDAYSVRYRVTKMDKPGSIPPLEGRQS